MRPLRPLLSPLPARETRPAPAPEEARALVYDRPRVALAAHTERPRLRALSATRAGRDLEAASEAARANLRPVPAGFVGEHWTVDGRIVALAVVVGVSVSFVALVAGILFALGGGP